MKDKSYITAQVDSTMNSLNGLQKAEASPFMFTRIQQKITNNIENNKLYKTTLRLATIMLVLLIINGFSFYHSTSSSNKTEPTAAMVIADYSLQYTPTDF